MLNSSNSRTLRGHKVCSMLLHLYPFLVCFILVTRVAAQSHILLPGDLTQKILEHREVRTGMAAPWIGALHTTESIDAVEYMLQTDSLGSFGTPVGSHRRQFFLSAWNDALRTADSTIESPTTHKPLWKTLYRSPAFLYETDGADFSLRVNPILDLQVGWDAEEERPVYVNQRGLQVRGSVDGRVFFFTEVTETQARFPDYVNRRIARDLAVPGFGFYKTNRSDLFGVSDARDLLNARGYVAFRLTTHIGLRLGTGRHFLGNGQRSLLLSDFSNNAPFLELNTRIGRIHYQNLWMELTAASNTSLPGDVALPRKYLAAHSLGIQINPAFELTLFEAVVFSRNNRFDLSYLNPVIFYRAVEQAAGSPDNVLLGLNVRADAFQQVRVYGQAVLDEFRIQEMILDNRGWWGNKFGWQFGATWHDAFGREDLRLQAEYNTVRPYTYSHRDSSARYTHYRQPLAHPLGANFREFLAILHWQPLPRWQLKVHAAHMVIGEDENDLNWGNNPLLSSDTRVREYENVTTQGARSRILMAGAVITWEVFHNAFFELSFLSRHQQSDLPDYTRQTTMLCSGFRMNVSRRNPLIQMF
jgi:hypothetical protein